jgi:hypothetical protein
VDWAQLRHQDLASAPFYLRGDIAPGLGDMQAAMYDPTGQHTGVVFATDGRVVNAVTGVVAGANVTVARTGVVVVVSCPSGGIGPQGPQGSAGTNGLNGTNGTAGPMGPPGTNGINGTNGAPGAPGPQGPSGSNGTNGSAAIISSITATNVPVGGSATVTNTGSATNATFVIGVPVGATGAQGIPGVVDYTVKINAATNSDYAVTVTGSQSNLIAAAVTPAQLVFTNTINSNTAAIAGLLPLSGGTITGDVLTGHRIILSDITGATGEVDFAYSLTHDRMYNVGGSVVHPLIGLFLGTSDTLAQQWTETNVTFFARARMNVSGFDMGAMPINNSIYSGDGNGLTNLPTLPYAAAELATTVSNNTATIGTNTAAIAALQSAYQTIYTNTFVASPATNVISCTNGYHQYLLVTATCQIGVPYIAYNESHSVRLDLDAGNYSVTWLNSNVVTCAGFTNGILGSTAILWDCPMNNTNFWYKYSLPQQ